MDFDWQFYISYYDDLKHFKTSVQALSHYKSFGKKENRLINKSQTECFGKELNQIRISKGISKLNDSNLDELDISKLNNSNLDEFKTIYFIDVKYLISY